MLSGVLFVVSVVGAPAIAPAMAQQGQTPLAPKASARASRVTLQVHPTVGDTLRMQMDQTYEMFDDADSAVTSPPMTTTVRVYTRAIVLKQTHAGTELLTLTDSVNVQPEDAGGMRMFDDMKRALEGRAVRILVASDGGIRVLSDGDDDDDDDDDGSAARTRTLVAQMPPMLPSGSVAVGQSWTRDVPVPLSAAENAAGSVRATFRLDSLGQATNRHVAYVSMRGTFTHAQPHGEGVAATDSTFGAISGTLQIDRQLQWVTDSRTTVGLTSLIWSKKRGAPMRIHMRITQWLRAVTRR
jgi:hypothetical protein